jgi:ABC-type Zn uptake system ZnuABC Zn-binding protein ZnuA
MEKTDYSKLSNAEIKAKLIVLENEFEHYKAEIKKLCEKLEEIESEYNAANNEIRLRKTIY